ncbi:MAG TPA: nicotinamide-nucleotide amidohydrolase family protein [Burkholderiales bacterium]|nr:nicotinamide-nucleotide amidohydrolase family protein [Burkholderiales bacterium]
MKPDDEGLYRLAEETGKALRQRGFRLATAESCTGGWAGMIVTAVPGSSAWYERGFITYTNEAKREMLGVAENTLERWGAVSEATVGEMALGALRHSRANMAVSISGIAGPDGGTAQKPVGTVCLAWAMTDGAVQATTCRFSGDRREVRARSVAAALRGVIELLS